MKKSTDLKMQTVLILDDIGAEFLSSWFRDEILGAILQYRMMERLPVFLRRIIHQKSLKQCYPNRVEEKWNN